MSEITEVVAAVLLRGGPSSSQFLLAQRPPGKVYAGFWEFPGGKVEPGESAAEALRRELREELGIEVDDLWPWLCREFTYPHAVVRLKFFRVRAWRGEVAPIEHSGFAWQTLGEAPRVTPILPANGPILQALALPPLYALTDVQTRGHAGELARLRQALADGYRLIQVRDKSLPREQRHALAVAVMALAASYPSAAVLINDDAQLAREVEAHGLHLSSTRLWQIDQRPPFAYVAASCHNAADLARAAQLGLDFAVLGPVLPTASHPGESGMGWPSFAQLVERSPLPIYALGGLRPELLDTACRHGGHGMAMLSGWP